MIYTLRSLRTREGLLRVRCPGCSEKRELRLDPDERRKAYYCTSCRTPYVVELFEDGLVQVA